MIVPGGFARGAALLLLFGSFFENIISRLNHANPRDKEFIKNHADEGAGYRDQGRAPNRLASSVTVQQARP
jgi:hypothetical protein